MSRRCFAVSLLALNVRLFWEGRRESHAPFRGEMRTPLRSDSRKGRGGDGVDALGGVRAGEEMGFHSRQATQRQTEVAAAATPCAVPRQTRECCTEAVACGLREISAVARASRDMRGCRSVLPAKYKGAGEEEKGREEKEQQNMEKHQNEKKGRAIHFI